MDHFKGTNNFHNYTKKGRFENKSNIRYMMDMKVELVKGDNQDYVRVYLHG